MLMDKLDKVRRQHMEKGEYEIALGIAVSMEVVAQYIGEHIEKEIRG